MDIQYSITALLLALKRTTSYRIVVEAASVSDPMPTFVPFQLRSADLLAATDERRALRVERLKAALSRARADHLVLKERCEQQKYEVFELKRMQFVADESGVYLTLDEGD